MLQVSEKTRATGRPLAPARPAWTRPHKLQVEHLVAATGTFASEIAGNPSRAQLHSVLRLELCLPLSVCQCAVEQLQVELH
jgi:hypothetical protein